MKKIFLVIIAFLVSALNISAQETNTLYISETTCNSGKQTTLTVNMKNTVLINSLEFELELPAGFSVVYDTEGNDIFPYVELLTDRTSTRKHDIVSSFKKTNGNLYVTIANKSATAAFSDYDGAICTVSIDVVNSVDAGNHSIKIKNIVLTDASDNSSIKPSNVEHTITVTKTAGIYELILNEDVDEYNTNGQKTKSQHGISIIKTKQGEPKKVIRK